MEKVDVPYFQQDTEYTCGPTSLQMVLSYYGVRYSEEHLAKKLRTSSDEGTHILEMRETATKLGFYCYVNNEASFEEVRFLLSLGVPPIVRFVEPDENDDHYAVVVAASDEQVVLNDPWNGPDLEFTKEVFLKRWTSNWIDDCHQWLMAVSPTELPLGRQFHPHE